MTEVERTESVMSCRSVLRCIHGGEVTLSETRDVPLSAALLLRASIFGCPNVGPGIVPCVAVVSVSCDGESLAGDEDWLGQNFRAVTNGTPPGSAKVEVIQYHSCPTLTA